MACELLAFAAFVASVHGASCAADNASLPVLRYFNVRGKAEPIRLALYDHGIPFVEDSFTSDQWGKDRSDGLKAKWSAEGRLAFGQVPLLEIDGLKLVQSQAILRYLGNKLGWYSGEAAALARIDIVAEGILDVKAKLVAIKGLEAGEAKVSRTHDYFTSATEAPFWLGYLETIVAGSPTFFAAGSAVPTHADYLLLDLLDTHDAVEPEAFATLLKTLPALTAWRERMLARPNIKAYLDSTSRRPA